MSYLPEQKRPERELTPRQQALLDTLPEVGYDPLAAAKAVGYVNPYDAVRSVTKEIRQIADEMIANSSLEAVSTIKNIMTSEVPLAGSKDKLEAAKTLLDRAGLAKKETIQHEHKVSGGVFILPEKDNASETIEGEYDVVPSVSYEDE